MVSSWKKIFALLVVVVVSYVLSFSSVLTPSIDQTSQPNVNGKGLRNGNGVHYEKEQDLQKYNHLKLENHDNENIRQTLGQDDDDNNQENKIENDDQNEENDDVYYDRNDDDEDDMNDDDINEDDMNDDDRNDYINDDTNEDDINDDGIDDDTNEDDVDDDIYDNDDEDDMNDDDRNGDINDDDINDDDIDDDIYGNNDINDNDDEDDMNDDDENEENDDNDLKNHDEREDDNEKIKMERAPIQENNSNTPVKALTCPGECPERACSNGRPRIPGVQITTTATGTNTLKKSHTYVSGNWGNVLSPYWAARAVAELGGYEYVGNPFGHGTWMEYLPTRAPPRMPRKDRFDLLCSNCTHYEFFNRGECSVGFGAIAPAVLTDTRAAITKHAQRAHPKEKQQIFQFFQHDDWLIYHRCTIFDHKAHAPAVLRTYDVIPDQGTFTVYVIKGRPEDPLHLCDILVQESSQYIQNRNPNVTVTILPQSTPFVDFSRLVFAPNVLVACVGSSWALWSAILANNNTVVSLLPAWNSNVQDLPTTVTFLDHLPTLQTTTFSQKAADQYGLSYGSIPNTPEAKEAVLHFFRNA